MGSFFTNIHVRKVASKAVGDALPKLTDGPAYVSPEANGWVTVYPEATEDQSEETLRAIAGGLSQALKADVLAFTVHDSDIALYWLFRNGTLVDEFNSAPDYFGNAVSEAERERVSGRVEVLLPLCIGGTTPEQLAAVLHPEKGPPTFAEEVVSELAKLLGLDPARASLGYRYFDEEGADLLEDADAFEPIGKDAQRKAPGDAQKQSAPVKAAPTFAPYPAAVHMLTQVWSINFEQNSPAPANVFSLFGKDANAIKQRMREQFDKAARELLKQAHVPGQPTFEECIAARDQGPEALAALIAARTPEQMTEIGVHAAIAGAHVFVGALFKHGLDLNAKNKDGRTTMEAATRSGIDWAIDRLLKAAAEGKKP